MRLFGTDGIRGEVGKYPLTAENILKLAKASSLVLRKNNSISRVVINKDTRLSGYIFEPALTSGFISMGIEVILVGPLPTPALTILGKSLRADFSVMITASHNQFKDNGLKFFSGQGLKISPEEENKIEDLFFNYDFDNFKIKQSNYGKAIRLKNAIGRYSEALKQSADRNLNYNQLKVILDCANGASYKVGPEVLFELGLDLHTIGNNPSGTNINQNCGSLYPSKASNLVKKKKYDIGICLDGDGDRVIIIDEKGNVLNGEEIIYIFAKYFLSKKKIKKGSVIVTNEIANHGLDIALTKLGLKLKRVKVGDKNILKEILDNKRLFFATIKFSSFFAKLASISNKSPLDIVPFIYFSLAIFSSSWATFNCLFWIFTFSLLNKICKYEFTIKREISSLIFSVCNLLDCLIRLALWRFFMFDKPL